MAYRLTADQRDAPTSVQQPEAVMRSRARSNHPGIRVADYATGAPDRALTMVVVDSASAEADTALSLEE